MGAVKKRTQPRKSKLAALDEAQQEIRQLHGREEGPEEAQGRPSGEGRLKQRRYQLWTAAEDTALRELPAQGVDPRKIAIRLRRTATGVRYRLQKLGIAFPGASQPTALPAKTKLPVQKTLSYPARGLRAKDS